MRPGLINTFAHLVSPSAEMRIWDQGIFSWNAYECSGAPLFSGERHAALIQGITKSRRSLNRRSAAHFIRRLRGLHRARPVADFLNELVCLDVETNGLGPDATITTAAAYDGRHIRLYVRGKNLDKLVPDLRRARVVVTFNGTSFDLPMLRQMFGWNVAMRHLDLMPILNALGYRGSLKQIEAARQIIRPPGLLRTGAEAVLLWKQFQNGNCRSLRELLAYNAADAVGLLTLASWAWLRSWDGYPMPVSALPIEPITFVYRRILRSLIIDNGILPLVV